VNLGNFPEPPNLSAWGLQADCPHKQENLLNWHDASIWPSGSVPTADSLTPVDLPVGVKVVISSRSLLPGTYGLITVPETTELIFADEEISLHTVGMSVNGAVKAGSPTCRLLGGTVTVTLHGARPANVTTVDNSFKGIVVNGAGVLSLHGAPFYQTWSRLATTAMEGENVLYLQDAINWQAGQEVVITTSQHKDSRDWHQNEVRTIDFVKACSHLGDGVTAVVFTEPLSYGHFGGVEYQAEVGLLSRRIIIQGSEDDSEPTDMEPIACDDNDYFGSFPCPDSFLTGYGATVVAIGSGGASLQLSNVEFFRVGQTNARGRYPVHFHLVVDGSTSYIEDCSFHRSYNKAVVVHGTNFARVSRNVAYDVIGHAFYLQDGVEEENIIEFNLAAHVHSLVPPVVGTSNLYAQNLDDVFESEDNRDPVDATACGFYFANAYNTIRGNAGVGGFSCFHFPNLERPVGLHRTVVMAPYGRPTLQFDANSCRSSGFWWTKAGGEQDCFFKVDSLCAAFFHCSPLYAFF